MPNWKKLIVSGSDASLNSLVVATNVNAQSFTGSLFGTSSWALNATTASFVTASNVYGPYGASSVLSASYAQTASYAVNITVSGAIQNVDYIDFDTTASYTLAEGRLGWDSGDGTLQLGLAGGTVQYSVGETLYAYVYNAEATTLTKGQAVYISGSQGNRVAVKLANDSGDPSSAGTLGLVAETIAAGGTGWVITEGPLRKLNTLGLTAGKLVFLSSTPGDYTQTPPTAPSHSVRLGYVERVSATVGSIFVKVDNGYEIGELHDVVDNTTTSSYGDLLIKSGSVWINSKQLTGSYTLTGSLSTSGSNVFIGNQTVTGSLFTSGSNTLIGSTTLTGSLNITGSTTQVGNNNLVGNTSLSGSLTISGSQGASTPTINIFGDIEQTGYTRFLPVTTNINTSISASYIYVSGTTNDLYFSQNGAGYSNTTRLRWLEGNLYTGLLNGGVITSQSSTVYQISSGSGIIVNLNASLNDNPYPTVQYLNWPNLSASIAPFTASYDQAFVGIDSTNNIFAQGTPFSNGQFDTVINIGNVLFQNGSTINGFKTQPSVAYGFEQSQNVFNRAFGPLKLSGYTLSPSGSSTGSLIVGSGTAYAPGSNYTIDPNEPYYTVDSGTNISKIFRYYQSGSSWVYNTNAGAGFTTVDPTQYSNNGVLTNVGAGNWSVQRVFWFPNSVTKAIVVYYGNAIYATENDALANMFESFVEAPNTAANAIYLGAIVINGSGVFTNPSTFTIYPGGLFRQVGGSGGGGSVVTQTLSGLSDVNISGPTDYQPLVYSTTQAKWINASFISASISGNAATATTASYVLNAVSASFATSASYALSSSYALNATSASSVTGGTTNYVALWKTNTALSRSAFYQDPNNNNYVGLFTNAPSYSLDVLGDVRAQVDLRGEAKVYFPNLAEGSPSTDVLIWDSAVGQLYRTGSSGLSVGSASFATSASRAISSATASYVLQSISASYAATASSADNFTIRNNFFVPSISDQRILYKSGSAVTGSNDFTWNYTSNQLTINGGAASGQIQVNPLGVDGVYLGARAGITAGEAGLYSANSDQSIALYDPGVNSYYYSNGNYKFDGNIHQFTGSAAITQNVTASNALITGTITAQTLVVQTVTSSIVYSSGSNRFGNQLSDTHQFTGSVSITGSLAASLTNVDQTNIVGYNTSTGQLFYQSTSSLSVTSASYAATASYATVFNISSSLYSAGARTAPAGAETAIITLNTGSYTAAFFDYTVSSGSNARAGTVMSVWNGASVQYTDNSTLDIGGTSDITLKVEVGGANAQLVATTTTSAWTVKTTYRLI